jgi:hypothetical protein
MVESSSTDLQSFEQENMHCDNREYFDDGILPDCKNSVNYMMEVSSILIVFNIIIYV